MASCPDIKPFSIEPLIEVIARRYVHDYWIDRDTGHLLDASCLHDLRYHRPSDGDVARVLGCTRMTVIRMRRDGMSVNQADKYAIALGLHPMTLWPDVYDAGLVPA